MSETTLTHLDRSILVSSLIERGNSVMELIRSLSWTNTANPHRPDTIQDVLAALKTRGSMKDWKESAKEGILFFRVGQLHNVYEILTKLGEKDASTVYGEWVKELGKAGKFHGYFVKWFDA